MSKIRFLGHAAFYIEGEGLKALIDPFLTGNPLASEGADTFTDLNYIFLSHGHGDHLGDVVPIARHTGATVISTAEICHYLGGKGLTCHAMHIGGRYRFPFGRVKLTPAFHGSGIQEGDRMLYGGMPAGFLIEVDGKKIYHAGDTGLTVEMQLLKEEGVKVAMLPIGGNYVMDEEDAARAVRMIAPEVAVPMHYDTFDLIQADPVLFREMVGEAARVAALKPGEELVF